MESSPSRMHITQQTLDADSTGGVSHLRQQWQEPTEEEPRMAAHLEWGEELEEDPVDPEDERGPVPPQPEAVHIFPDPYTRGQYDNVTGPR